MNEREKIRGEMKTRGWTQSELASRSGVDQAQISRYLKGAEISSNALKKLMAELEPLRINEQAATRYKSQALTLDSLVVEKLEEDWLENLTAWLAAYKVPIESLNANGHEEVLRLLFPAIAAWAQFQAPPKNEEKES